MKKCTLAFAVLALLAGCVKETSPIGENYIEKEFTASFEQGTKASTSFGQEAKASTSFEQGTKTSVDDAGKVDWCKDDVISYYTASEGQINSITVPESSHSVSFTAKVGAEDSFIVAAYGGEISAPQGGSMTLTGAVTAGQTGKFEDAHISVAKRCFKNGNYLYFKNITSLIKFSLERADISSVTFTADDGTKIHGAGKVYFTFNSEDVSAAFGENEGGNAINVSVDGAGTYYISTLPCSIGGFTISYFDSDGKLIGTSTSAKTLAPGKGKIVDLGALDGRIVAPQPVDLSAGGTANCYIAPKSDTPYRFKATVKGNSTESVGAPEKTKVLWESFGTDVTPTVGDVVSDVSFVDGYVKFTSGRDGNAVIAVTDGDNSILWSWHIWVCDGFDPEATAQEYNNDAGTMMDRNLGATSAAKGDVKALGLLYQWGRKDPFIGSSSISSAAAAASTQLFPAAESSDDACGNIAYSTENPTTFITRNSYNYDWYYSGDATTDNSRWQTSSNAKSIYDPCPVGWRVCDGIWAKAFGSTYLYTGPYDYTNKGMNFGSGNGKPGKQLGAADPIWYPYSGFRSDESGALCRTGETGHCWSCSPSGKYAYYLLFSTEINPETMGNRAAGRAVRCSKDD